MLCIAVILSTVLTKKRKMGLSNQHTSYPSASWVMGGYKHIFFNTPFWTLQINCMPIASLRKKTGLSFHASHILNLDKAKGKLKLANKLVPIRSNEKCATSPCRSQYSVCSQHGDNVWIAVSNRVCTNLLQAWRHCRFQPAQPQLRRTKVTEVPSVAC